MPRFDVEMPSMSRNAFLLLATMVAAIALAGAALAQGVAPGGGFYNSTAFGSGTGGVIGGTGPVSPNGSNQAPQPQVNPPPIGGTPPPSVSAPAASMPTASSTYRQPHTASTPRPPSIEPLHLPYQTVNDLTFLRGCWRTDVFQRDGVNGLSTWCFDGKGAGKVMYTRIDQPNFFCHGTASAAYSPRQLDLRSKVSTCSDRSTLVVGDLDCRQASGGIARCVGGAATPGDITVGLYKVR